MLQVKVNLSEYPKFWEQLKVAQYRPGIKFSGVNAAGVESLIEQAFGFKIKAYPQDRLGHVVMDDETFTWFVMQWS